MKMKLSADIKAKTPEQQQDYQTGKNLGQKAYNNGLKRVAFHDPELFPLLTGKKVGESIHLLKGWTDG